MSNLQMIVIVYGVVFKGVVNKLISNYGFFNFFISYLVIIVLLRVSTSEFNFIMF